MKKALLILLVAMGLAACGANLNNDRYETSGTGTVNTVSEGVIINVRRVTIADQDGEVGQLAGGLVGAVAGGMLGDDNKITQTISAVGGAVLGGYVGGKMEEGLSSQGGIEYIVKLDSGRTITLTQGDDVEFTVGQSVYVLDADYGERARIIAK